MSCRVCRTLQTRTPLPTITLVRSPESGKLEGLSDKDKTLYSRFLEKAKKLAGDVSLTFSWAEPRSPQYHRRFFALLGQLFDAQEQFDDADDLRQWLTVGAGHVRFVPGPKGRMVALPVSIKWARMEQDEFEEVARDVWAFAYSEHARAFLWPHMSNEQSYEMMTTILDGGR